MHAAPEASKMHIDNIHCSNYVFGLVLTFRVSFAIAARKTAQILKQVFNIQISYQTVLNYVEAAAPYCHHFNFTYDSETKMLFQFNLPVLRGPRHLPPPRHQV